MFENLLTPGKVNMIIDGQFGSTGKGLLAHAIANDNHIDIAIADLSPNAGHTFLNYKTNKYDTVRMLPISGIIHDRSIIYYPPSAVIDPSILLDELKRYDIDKDRVCIHPRAAIISKQDIANEQHLSIISSTLSGVGGARASKMLRMNPLAQGCPELVEYVSNFDIIGLLIDSNCTCLVETSQGLDLGIDYGYQYPNCTSKDVTPSHVLANLCAHPSLLGKVCIVMRTYPIRVGNTENGYSGDVYPGSVEISFDKLDVKAELSSVTKKKRRVFTFSIEQWKRSIDICKPDIILLNYANYVNDFDELRKYKFDVGYRPTHVSYGRTPGMITTYTIDEP